MVLRQFVSWDSDPIPGRFGTVDVNGALRCLLALRDHGYETGYVYGADVFKFFRRFKPLLLFLMFPNGGEVMSNIPDTTMPDDKWLDAMCNPGMAVNMRSIRDAAGSNKRLWLLEGSLRVSSALRMGILEATLTDMNGEKVNVYTPKPEAIDFWRNGREQSLSPQEILDGWKAMQSLLEDVRKDD